MSDIPAEAEKVAVAAAKKAGGVALRHFRTDLKIESKGGNPRNIVTDADIESDAAIKEAILASFPDHGIVSEESPEVKGNGYVWYVDPIDGTTNFSSGSAYFCTSIGLAHGDQLLAAAIYSPLTGELYTAAKGKGAFLNGKRITMPGSGEVAKAVMCFDMCYEESKRTQVLKVMNLFITAKSLKITGSGALAMCEVAAGRSDAYVNLCGSPWDFAAAALIVREAGGAAIALDGKDWTPTVKKGIVATNKSLNKTMLPIINAAIK